MGKSEFIGRAMAKPIVKFLKEPYSKPVFPPKLEWYQLVRGSEKAGEVLATFELLETFKGNSGESVLPNDVPKLLNYSRDDILPVPDTIRPTLSDYRLEVLFWGLRDMKKINFKSVDNPRIDIECAGNMLTTSTIQNMDGSKKLQFTTKTIDLKLPEEEIYRPPLTIRVFDCRTFGRDTLVGTHTIKSIHNYMIAHQFKIDDENDEKAKSLASKKMDEPIMHEVTFKEINPNSRGVPKGFPLFKREPFFPVSGPSTSTKKIIMPKDKKNKNKKKGADDDDDDEDKIDWWSKYTASVNMMVEMKKSNVDSSGNKGNDRNKNEYNQDAKNEPGPSGLNKLKKLKSIVSTSKAVVALTPLKEKKSLVPQDAIFKVHII